jgi:radical SAM protein with 4Fe4S-binding SPASM domain
MEKAEDYDWICKAHCSFYKPQRVEEERCRGYSLAAVVFKDQPEIPPASAAAPFDPQFEADLLRDAVCSACPFLADGCDYRGRPQPPGAVPCGGLIFLAESLRNGELEPDRLRAADFMERHKNEFLGTTPQTFLKRLEEDYLYHTGKDELYEVNEEAVKTLEGCDGAKTVAQLELDPEFLAFCLGEDLLELNDKPAPRVVSTPGKSPDPSLRYLEWLVTSRCNLSCAHCYLGSSGTDDFPKDLIESLLDQFSRMQGLRILVSGGEPLLYPHFDYLNDCMPRYPIRAVLLTNGTLLNKERVGRLNFHEVQISLDGMEEGHEAIRGKGSFRKAVRAMELICEAGRDLSVATMVHRKNLEEWDAMRDLITGLGAREWSVDLPCVAGSWAERPDLAVNASTAAEKMAYGFGGSYHGSSPGWTCGRHLGAVLPSGNVCRCGLFPETILGSVTTGLREAWEKVRHIPLAETDCNGCAHGDECGGGCRFRAGSSTAKDEVMCRAHGVAGPKDQKD